MMTAKEAYTRAKQLAQSGEYEAALQALIGYDHAKIEALRQQIREAIAAKSGSVAQEEKQEKAKATKRQLSLLPLLIVVLAIAGGLLYFFWWLPANAMADELFQTVKLSAVCREVYAGARERLSVDSFLDACQQEAESALIRYRAEVKYCLDQTDQGRLETQFVQCLADNGFEFSGTWIGTAR
jgi:hypothetical protein